MSALFQKVREQFHQQLPFVCYCKPNSDKIISLLQKNDILFELKSKDKGFAFVSFDNKEKYIIPDSCSDIYFETISKSDYVVSNNTVFHTDEAAKQHFESLVEKAVIEIENGTFEKVVLSRRELIALPNFDFELVFSKFIINYPTAFKYCFYHPKIGFWMGATPEQLLKVADDSIQTVALAGTQLCNDINKVIWEEKEINEQRIVSDFIVQSLSKYSKTISKSEPYTFQAGSIVHIKTDIQVQLNDQSDLEEIVSTLHPTPAVCGFPKEKAKQFILNHEGYDRTFYAGFLGEWNKDFLTFTEGSSDLFVNLRCMKIVDNQAQLFIGCGINKGSIPEKEFLETVNKSQTMKKVL